MVLPHLSLSRRSHLCLAFASMLLVFTASIAFGQGYQWRLAIAGQQFHSVAFNPLSKGRIIFAGPRDFGGIFRSDDGGMTWRQYQRGDTAVNISGDTVVNISDVHQILCIPSDTSVVLALSNHELYRSTDGGMSWCDTSSLYGVDGEDIAYHAAEDILYYGQNTAATTWKSTDHGLTWTSKNTTMGYSYLCSLGASPDIPTVLLAGSGDSGLITRSTDEGLVWTTVSTETEGEVPKIVFSDYATNGIYNHGIAIATRWKSQLNSIVATSDDGLTWSSLNSPNANQWALDVDQHASMISRPGDPAYPLPLHFWTGLFDVLGDTITNGLVQETTDGGFTWRSTNFPVYNGSDTNHPIVLKIVVLKYDITSGRIAVATDGGLFIAESPSSVAESSPSNKSISVEHYGNQLRIDASGQMLTSIELYDMLGRPVFRAMPHQEIYQMSMLSFPPGAYLLKTTLLDGPPTVKMMVLP